MKKEKLNKIKSDLYDKLNRINNELSDKYQEIRIEKIEAEIITIFSENNINLSDKNYNLIYNEIIQFIE